MSASPAADDDVLDGLEPDERARLADLRSRLVAAGPPAELPPTLAEPPEPGRRRGETLARRYRFTAVAAVVVVGGLLVALGYALGGGVTPEQTVERADLTGPDGATGELVVRERDAAGNWPVRLTVRGLDPPSGGAVYELWLTRTGRLAEPAGRFRVAGGGETAVTLNAPYDLQGSKGWAVIRSGHDDTVLLHTGDG